jgi:RNA polymerase sigma-70 factor (ECF subfamily)
LPVWPALVFCHRSADGLRSAGAVFIPMPLNASPDFPETRWSLVLAANGERAARALEELCAAYWFPLYAFARRCGHAPPAAEDLTQGFFALLLSRELWAKADRERGRLRSFLLGAFKNFMHNETRRQHAEKRGGENVTFSLDQAQAEAWFGAEPAADDSPERQFDRDWAHATVAQAFAAVEAECAHRGKAALFARLREFLSWEQAEPQMAAAAQDLGLSTGAVRVAVHRLRLAFRRQLEAEIAQSVTTPEELREELRHLLAILQE